MNNLLNSIEKRNSVAENQQTASELLNPNTPIHNDLTIFFLALLEEMKNYSNKEYNELEQRRNELVNIKKINIRPIEREIEKEKASLAKLGFSNAKSERLENLEVKLTNAKLNFLKNQNEIREFDLRINYIKNQQITKEILLRLKKDFGEEALFVRYNDFEKVINKYNLVCGRLSDYKGVLPEYKMADIKRVLTMDIPEFWKDKISHLKYREDASIKFPFVVRESSLFKKTNFFIAAPSYEMRQPLDWRDSLVGYKYSIRFKHEENFLTKDPFICAHTKWGIIIFTKWGEEAEDEIIKKYET